MEAATEIWAVNDNKAAIPEVQTSTALAPYRASSCHWPTLAP